MENISCVFRLFWHHFIISTFNIFSNYCFFSFVVKLKTNLIELLKRWILPSKHACSRWLFGLIGGIIKKKALTLLSLSASLALFLWKIYYFYLQNLPWVQNPTSLAPKSYAVCIYHAPKVGLFLMRPRLQKKNRYSYFTHNLHPCFCLTSTLSALNLCLS